MKCSDCQKGKLVKKTIADTVEIPGGPILRVPKLEAYICSKCKDIVMSARTLQARDHAVLAVLVKYYSTNTHEMTGRAGMWIRKSIGLTLEAWSSECDISVSGLSKSATRDSILDHHAAKVLIAFTIDYLKGGHAAINLLRSIDKQMVALAPPSSAEIQEAV